MGINFDTGNAYLCGHDPYKWLAHVSDRLVHVHAKDITVQQSNAERGKVTGTAVGCACGEAREPGLPLRVKIGVAGSVGILAGILKLLNSVFDLLKRLLGPADN